MAAMSPFLTFEFELNLLSLHFHTFDSHGIQSNKTVKLIVAYRYNTYILKKYTVYSVHGQRTYIIYRKRNKIKKEQSLKIK